MNVKVVRRTQTSLISQTACDKVLKIWALSNIIKIKIQNSDDDLHRLNVKEGRMKRVACELISFMRINFAGKYCPYEKAELIILENWLRKWPP